MLMVQFTVGVHNQTENDDDCILKKMKKFIMEISYTVSDDLSVGYGTRNMKQYGESTSQDEDQEAKGFLLHTQWVV